MIKALALESFWSQLFSSKPKRIGVIKPASADTSLRFWLATGLIAANAVLLLSYIYGVNDFASKGYEIKALQTKLSQLNDDNKKINLKISEATSMVAIQSDFLNANFVPAGTAKFLVVNPNANQLTQR